MCKCMSCGKDFLFSFDCFETEDGDLCPDCTREMREDEEQEIRYQEEGQA